MGKTFAFTRESFANETEMLHMEKAIIEHGGRVIDDSTKSMILIEEDGFNQEAWKRAEGESNQQIVHFRFVQECI